MKRYILTILSFIIITVGKSEEINSQQVSLFNDTTPLKLTLVTDVVSLKNDKSKDPEYIEGMLLHHITKYKFESFEIKVKARGGTRRLSDLCDFPPLKFNFKKKKVKNSVFEGLDKMKFVSQCRQQEDFQDYLLEEYLLYKTFNILTDDSYRVRLVEIVIKDEKLRVDEITMKGFLIEDDEAFAERRMMKEYGGAVYSQDSCEVQSIDILSTFQYMIGNTDWYVNTRHNIDVYERKDGELIPVPFDFDFAGVINTPYAVPSKEIPITRVKERYYKGSCRDFEAFNPVIDLFNSKKSIIFELYNSFESLDKSIIRKSLRYYSKFYKILNDPSQAEPSFYQACNARYIPLSSKK